MIHEQNKSSQIRYRATSNFNKDQRSQNETKKYMTPSLYNITQIVSTLVQQRKQQQTHPICAKKSGVYFFRLNGKTLGIIGYVTVLGLCTAERNN